METEKQALPKIDPKKHKIPFSFIYIVFDVILRFILFWMYKTEICNGWLYWLSQIVFIPLLVFIFSSIGGREKKWKELLKKNDSFTENDKLEVEGSAISVIFCLLAIALFAFFSWNSFASFPPWLQRISTVFSLFIYAFYILVVFMLSYSKVKLKEKKHEKFCDTLSVDGNDEKLIKLEVSLSQFSNKVDTYTLESALLGALTFSGFLAILALDKSVFNNIQAFLMQVSDIFYNLVNFNINNLSVISLNQQMIISTLAIESIICSLFFLLVLVSRTRFHDTISAAELHIKMARELNNKEEEYDIVYHQQPSNKVIQERLELLNVEINQKLRFGSQKLKELESIVNYMNYVRNIGLFLFVIILSTAAGIVSYKLSIAFLILYIISYTYHKMDSWAKKRSWVLFIKK